jgi:hypothetical protein
MASAITINVDAQGNATVAPLSAGVFYSTFATPPDQQIRGVISINAADLYTLVINAPAVTEASADDGPVTFMGSTATQATFSVDASQLPMSQSFGMAMCQVGTAVSYSLGVIVNPATVSLPIGIDSSGMQVEQDDVPVGVHCNTSQQKISVWAGGGYSFAFALPADGNLQLDFVEFDPPSSALPNSISDDKLTAWIFNNYTASNPGFQVAVKFHCSPVPPPDVRVDIVIDPTIINNPINQGGVGGSGGVFDKWYEPVGARVDQRGGLAA